MESLQHNGAIIENVEWLSPNHAIDIFIAVLPIEEIRELLEALLGDLEIDFIVQGTEGRRKKLLICDMDSTVIEQECIDELADCLGIKPQISAITEKAMNGELDFKAALRERVALLKGLPEGDLQKVYDTRITYSKGIKQLTATMKANGAKCVLVSGGFSFFTSRVRAEVGFDLDESNILEIENGQLNGKVKEPILDSTSKLNALRFHCDDIGVSPFAAAAVGDGANDLPMIKNAGLGIAYRAKENVKRESTHHINIADLRNIYMPRATKTAK